MECHQSYQKLSLGMEWFEKVSWLSLSHRVPAAQSLPSLAFKRVTVKNPNFQKVLSSLDVIYDSAYHSLKLQLTQIANSTH